MAALESSGLASDATPFYGYLCADEGSINSGGEGWGSKVRAASLSAMASFLRCFRFKDVEDQSPAIVKDWIRTFAWILSIAGSDPDSAIRIRVIRVLLLVVYQQNVLAARPKTTEVGRLLRLCVGRLWRLLQRSSSADGRLRVVAFKLYRAVWGLHDPPAVSSFVDTKSHEWLSWTGINVEGERSRHSVKITLRRNVRGFSGGVRIKDT